VSLATVVRQNLRLGALLLVFTLASACGTTPRASDALGAWRSGRRAAALDFARGEVERFRAGNDLSRDEVADRLAEIDRLLADGTPILLPDAAPPGLPEDPTEPGPSVDDGLRRDLASTGATRVLRALRVVERLRLGRFSTELIAIIWRRDPYVADGVLLTQASTALRSVTVKTAALRALEAIR
jgi:hypothetical protein